MVKIEVCIDNIESLFTAQNAGADRIELCNSLALGGLSPSSGLIKQVLKHATIPVNIMVRPRDGDFLYSSFEIEMMLSEIHAAHSFGAHGVVLGVLNDKAQIDVDVLNSLMSERKNMSVTFHRAIDCCTDTELAIDTILTAGCDRVLTSGTESQAELGLDTIRKMVEQSRGRLSIMPGAGINANNVTHIINNTGVNEVHMSGKTTRSSYMKSIVNCGYLPEFMGINVTSGESVHAVKQAIKGF